MRILLSAVLAAALAATGAAAATFSVFEAGTATLLGTFEAPAGGGPLTAASFALDGGVFDVLDAGSTAPVYDATNNWITGAGNPFGGIRNSVAYNTSDGMGPITCGIGECVLALTDSPSPMEPPEWALNYLPMMGSGAVLDFGRYEIQAIPLPATALLLAGALVGLAAAGGQRRRR